MIEVGVQQGDFAVGLLQSWSDIEIYYVIDPWLSQENYKDNSNNLKMVNMFIMLFYLIKSIFIVDKKHERQSKTRVSFLLELVSWV
jgi:hypothetical protein